MPRHYDHSRYGKHCRLYIISAARKVKSLEKDDNVGTGMTDKNKLVQYILKDDLLLEKFVPESFLEIMGADASGIKDAQQAPHTRIQVWPECKISKCRKFELDK